MTTDPAFAGPVAVWIALSWVSAGALPLRDHQDRGECWSCGSESYLEPTLRV